MPVTIPATPFSYDSKPVPAGMSVATSILKGIEDIGIHEFTERDVVRHRLVQKIIMAYDKYEREKKIRDTERREKAWRAARKD